MPAHLILYNPGQTEDDPAAEAAATLAGDTIVDRWSIRFPAGVTPGRRLFFYHTGKPRGIFAAGVALPVNIPAARKWYGNVPDPFEPGLAAYEYADWRGQKETARYINAEWEMMVDPKEGRVLVPFERLRSESPFTRVFTKKSGGGIKGHAPQWSGSRIDDEVATALYAECVAAFRAVLREKGNAPHAAILDDAPAAKREGTPRKTRTGGAVRRSAMTPEERAKIERAAVDAVEAHYRELGCEVVSREYDYVGWDLDVCKGGAIFRRVEVKGTQSSDVHVELTPNEYAKSGDSRYRLAVVRNALAANPACAIYARKGGEWRRVSGMESGGDKGASERLTMEEKTSAIVRA